MIRRTMPSERVQRRIDRLLDRAETAADEEDWTTVLGRAEAVLAVDPGNQDAIDFISMADRVLTADGTTLSPAPRDAPRAISTAPDDSEGSVTDTTPTSFASGRYTVSEFLGEGGKKRVYLAHDELLDRDVAFALIKTEGLDEVSRTRISREAQAMGRLGDI